MYLQFQRTYQFHLFSGGLVLPDFAMLRDRAITLSIKSLFYLSFGWSGRAKRLATF
jgi:hypothetical protein